MVTHTRVIFYHLLLRHKVVMTSQQHHYCLVSVEEVDYQEPLPRNNGWRYTGPDGRPYRQQ
eukprot:9141-Heterococcus_DN1.PRE.3